MTRKVENILYAIFLVQIFFLLSLATIEIVPSIQKFVALKIRHPYNLGQILTNTILQVGVGGAIAFNMANAKEEKNLYKLSLRMKEELSNFTLFFINILLLSIIFFVWEGGLELKKYNNKMKNGK